MWSKKEEYRARALRTFPQNNPVSKYWHEHFPEQSRIVCKGEARQWSDTQRGPSRHGPTSAHHHPPLYPWLSALFQQSLSAARRQVLVLPAAKQQEFRWEGISNSLLALRSLLLRPMLKSYRKSKQQHWDLVSSSHQGVFTALLTHSWPRNRWRWCTRLCL